LAFNNSFPRRAAFWTTATLGGPRKDTDFRHTLWHHGIMCLAELRGRDPPHASQICPIFHLLVALHLVPAVIESVMAPRVAALLILWLFLLWQIVAIGMPPVPAALKCAGSVLANGLHGSVYFAASVCAIRAILVFYVLGKPCYRAGLRRSSDGLR